MLTVHVSTLDPPGRFQSTLLERSFRQVRQTGELIRLVASRPSESPATGEAGRAVRTPSWDRHPWTLDRYPGYQRPASILHWLVRERVAERSAGPILVLDTRSILQRAVPPPAFGRVAPGRALATPWRRLPTGDGPFGLDDCFSPLETLCVDTTLELPPLTLPAVIHPRDLLDLCPRWLELTASMRSLCLSASGPSPDAERVAFLVAAAEYGVELAPSELSVDTDAPDPSAPILAYDRPVESPRGEIVWDPQVHRAGDPVFPERAGPGAGRELLLRIADLGSTEVGTTAERAKISGSPHVRHRPASDPKP